LVATIFLPFFRRTVTMTGSATSTRARAPLAVAVADKSSSVGGVLSPSSNTVGAVVSLGSAFGSGGSSPVSHGLPGSTGGPGSVVVTVIVPFIPPAVRPPWIEQ
jgi:hypothetical protein